MPRFYDKSGHVWDVVIDDAANARLNKIQLPCDDLLVAALYAIVEQQACSQVVSDRSFPEVIAEVKELAEAALRDAVNEYYNKERLAKVIRERIEAEQQRLEELTKGGQPAKPLIIQRFENPEREA